MNHLTDLQNMITNHFPAITEKPKRKAFVSKALNYDPLAMWAAVIPGKKTTWHATEKEARILVNEYNASIGENRSDYFETSQAQES